MKKIGFFLASVLIMTTLSSEAQEITFYTPSTVRVVKAAPSPRQGHNLSLVVKASPENVKLKVRTSGSTTTYTSASLVVTVDSKTGKVTFSDRRGNILLREGTARFKQIGNGPDAGSFIISQGFVLDKEEPIYGLGLLQNGKMNQRGEHRHMVQSNLEDYAHFFQSLKGYGVYWDNYSPTDIDDGEELVLESQVGNQIDYYFMFGGNADGVIEEMRHLTGQVPMLPLWTYGFHQCRERYKSSKELLEVVGQYRKLGIPFDGIIQDWQYWDNNYLWNAMDFLSENFRDYRHMIDSVHEANAHISISIWASFGPQTLQYRQLEPKGLLLDFSTWPQSGATGWPPQMDYPSGVRVYDPYCKEARDIYWQHLTKLHNAGIDAWWMDSTDPDHFGDENDFDQTCPITDPSTGGTYSGSWRSVRNAFPLCSVEGVYDNQRACDKDKRVFILTRSYFAGQQRTGANTWSGDTQSSWDSFRAQVPICLNYTLTANPHVNTDIGGFFAAAYNDRGFNSAPHNPLFQELFVRWMQFGVFCPMMRSHGADIRREIYEFGKAGDPVYDALVSAVRLRYELLPYIYSQSWQVSSNDDSFMRALVMDFKDDHNVWDNNREFMFGPSMLVAPVVNALYTTEKFNEEGFDADWSADKKYPVYLPAGAIWYDYWTGRRLEGGQTVEADAPILHSPLYVRAGSILPLCRKNVQFARISDWDNLDITVYPGTDGHFTLYEDEGDNYNYESGCYSTIDFNWNDSSKTLTIGRRNGSFEGMIPSRTFVVKTCNGQPVTVEYDGTKKSIKLK